MGYPLVCCGNFVINNVFAAEKWRGKKRPEKTFWYDRRALSDIFGGKLFVRRETAGRSRTLTPIDYSPRAENENGYKPAFPIYIIRQVCN